MASMQQYMVRWNGYDSDEDSWVPASEMIAFAVAAVNASLRESKKLGPGAPEVKKPQTTQKIQSNQISGQSDSFLFAPNGAEQCWLETWRANVRCASTTTRVLLLASDR